MADIQQLEQAVCALLAETLRVDPVEVTPETEFGDLPQWDSMGHMEVMVSLEKAYGVDINADTITDLVSVKAITAHIEELGHD